MKLHQVSNCTVGAFTPWRNYHNYEITTFVHILIELFESSLQHSKLFLLTYWKYQLSAITPKFFIFILFFFIQINQVCTHLKPW